MKFSQLKPKYLLALGIILLFFCYKFAIKNTINLKNNISELNAQADAVRNAHIGIEDLINKKTSIENILGVNNVEANESQQSFLTLINEFSKNNGVFVSELPQSENAQQGEYTIETNIIVLQGGFINLLKTVYHLEQHPEIGKIISTRYKSERNIKTNKLILKLTIYIQNFKK